MNSLDKIFGSKSTISRKQCSADTVKYVLKSTNNLFYLCNKHVYRYNKSFKKV